MKPSLYGMTSKTYVCQCHSAGIMNATDWEGNTAVVRCAMQDSRDTLRKLLSSKAAIERHLLDLSIQNFQGRNVLHYLVLNRDKHNIRLVLNLLEDAGNALDAVDCEQQSPLKYCYTNNCLDLADIITAHPKVREGKRVNLESVDAAGKTLMHLAAEDGNLEFWRILIRLDWCDLSLRDLEGDTPLMLAVRNNRRDLLELWLDQQTGPHNKIMTVRNNAGHNLFMLVLMHLETDVIKKFINLIDLSHCIDQCDQAGNNGLLITAKAEKWEILKIILENKKIQDLAIDVHPRTKEGHSTLVLVLIAFVKLERKILNYQMKNDSQNLSKTKQESDSLWELVRTLLDKEKDMHGTNPVSSKEAGFKSIKKQLESSSQIKSPLTDSVLTEYAKLYNVNIKAKPKKKPEPIVEPVKEEPKVLPLSSFQQKMNDIYQQGLQAEKKKNAVEEMKEVKKPVDIVHHPKPKVEKVQKIENNSANNPVNLESEKILNLVSVVEKKVTNAKSELKIRKVRDEKKNLRELEDAINEEILWAQEQKRISKEEETQKVVPVAENSENQNSESGPASTEEPSLEEIRSRWKKKKPRTEIKKEDFDVGRIFEDIAKKAEEKVNLNNSKADSPEVNVKSDNAAATLIDSGLDSKNIMNLINLTEKKVEEKKKELSEKQVDTVLRENLDVLRTESSAKTEKMNTKKISTPLSSVEKKVEKDTTENYLEDAINEEVQWAYEQKRIMKEEMEKTNGVREQSNDKDNSLVSKKSSDDAKSQKTKEEEVVNLLTQKAEEKVLKEKEEMKKARQKEELKRSEMENKRKKEKELEMAINEEILWANEQKKMSNDIKTEQTRAEERISKEKEETKKAREEEDLKRSVRENKQKEKELEMAINEEILWANEQKKMSNDIKIEPPNSLRDLTEERGNTNPAGVSQENVTPPAPARRRRTGGAEEQEVPVIPNRKGRTVEGEPSPARQRTLGVGVELRPGYAHASTQTDPVKTCDFAV